MWIKTHLLMEARDGEKVEQVMPNGFHYLLKISGKMVGFGLDKWPGGCLCLVQKAFTHMSAALTK